MYKNTLARFAAREAGIEGLDDLLVGPTAITFVHGDLAAVAKSLKDFSKTNQNLVLQGGVVDGKAVSAELHRCTCIAAFTRSHARPICRIAPRTPTQYGLWPQGSDRPEGSRLRHPSARVSGHPLIRNTKLKTLYFQGFISKGESKWLLARKRSSTGSQHSALSN